MCKFFTKYYSGLLGLFFLVFPVMSLSYGELDEQGITKGKRMNYYGMDQSFQAVEYGQVSEEQAIQIVNDRFSKLKPSYNTAEEAIAETMFGFYPTEAAFIEISINAPTQISFKFEMQLEKSLLGFSNVYRKEVTLNSREALITLVRSFFNMKPNEYKSYLEHHSN